MLSGKPNITSDSSSGDETDQPENTGGVGRSYECSFCKRGFTNAQALGGHMNIHRKDKAKAKKKDITIINSSPRSSSFNIHDQDDHFTTQKFNFPAISSHEQRIYSSSLGAYMRCQLYFPGPNPNNQLHVNCDRFGLGLGSGTRKDHHHHHHQYRMDQSLSLRIGSEDHHVGGADHVDLELRLGQHP